MISNLPPEFADLEIHVQDLLVKIKDLDTLRSELDSLKETISIISTFLNKDKLVFKQGGSANPVQTSITDVPGTEFELELDKETDVLFVVGGRIKITGGRNTAVRLNINGTDQFPDVFGSSDGGVLETTDSRIVEITLPAGTHTIKLRAVASDVNAVSFFDAYILANIGGSL